MMIYIISFFFVIIAISISVLVWYFSQNSSNNKNKNESFFSATVNTLKKYYSNNRETFNNTMEKSIGKPSDVMGKSSNIMDKANAGDDIFADRGFTITDKSISIWNDILSLVSSDYFKDCKDNKKSASAKCYISYKESIGQPLDDDTAIALLLLDYAYIYETHKNDPDYIKEIENKQLTDIISYDKDSKIVTIKSPNILPVGTYNLNNFMKKYKDLHKIGKIDENSFKSCFVCGKYMAEK